MLSLKMAGRCLGQAALRSSRISSRMSSSLGSSLSSSSLPSLAPLRAGQRFNPLCVSQQLGFSKAIRMYQISAAEKDKYAASFKKFDVDGDGRVTHEELTAFLQDIGMYPGPQMVQEMMKAADKDNDGAVDLNEFLKVIEERTFVAGTFRGIASSSDDSAQILPPSAEEKATYSAAFKKFDLNGDGRVTREELGAFLQSINLNPGPQTIDAMMKAADKDNSGSVSEEELLKVMQEDTFVAGALRGAADRA